jgi:dihydrolipoamide dehydrogenase
MALRLLIKIIIKMYSL